MNESSFIREQLSKNVEPEKFFTHVMSVVEKELEEWEHDVIVLYYWPGAIDEITLTFIIDGKHMSFYVGKKEVEGLQRKGPFHVDRLIWTELVKRGVIIKEDDYMKAVFPKE